MEVTNPNNFSRSASRFRLALAALSAIPFGLTGQAFLGQPALRFEYQVDRLVEISPSFVEGRPLRVCPEEVPRQNRGNLPGPCETRR